MADNKTRPAGAEVDAFIASVAHPVRRADAEALRAMMERLSGEPAALWGSGIIGFGAYHYVYDSGREGDMPLIGFSPRKANMVLYVMPGFSAYEDLLARLGKHKIGKSCLYVNKLADVDMDALEELAAASLAHMRAKYG